MFQIIQVREIWFVWPQAQWSIEGWSLVLMKRLWEEVYMNACDEEELMLNRKDHLSLKNAVAIHIHVYWHVTGHLHLLCHYLYILIIIKPLHFYMAKLYHVHFSTYACRQQWKGIFRGGPYTYNVIIINILIVLWPLHYSVAKLYRVCFSMYM